MNNESHQKRKYPDNFNSFTRVNKTISSFCLCFHWTIVSMSLNCHAHGAHVFESASCFSHTIVGQRRRKTVSEKMWYTLLLCLRLIQALNNLFVRLAQRPALSCESPIISLYMQFQKNRRSQDPNFLQLFNVYPKLQELGSWTFEIIFTPHVSHVKIFSCPEQL